MDRLQKQSFGLIMLLLAIVAIAPGISIVGGLLLLIPAFQMIAGRAAPVFPRRIADRALAYQASWRCCAARHLSAEIY
jgi:hypothetical protein